MFFQNKLSKNKLDDIRGFTLIEVVTAVTVVTVGVVGAFAVVQKVAGYTSLSSSQLTATYLAQEGIEIVRNIRDGNWLDPAIPFWDDGITSGAAACCICVMPCSCECEADYINNIQYLDAYSDRFLNVDVGFYKYSGGGAETRFKRKIIVGRDDADILNVTTTVSWSEKGRSYEISVEETLYNSY